MARNYILLRISILCLCSIPLLPPLAQAQPDLVSRLATYDGSGLVSISPEAVYTDISATSNYSNPQTNMAHHAGVYYHVFSATVGDADIYLRTSTDGLTWTAPVQVNDDIPGGSSQGHPQLVVYDDGGSTIIVVNWEDLRAASSQMRTATSIDGGLTFAPSVPVSTHTDADYLYGNIAVDGAGRLYAAWSRFAGGCFSTSWFTVSDDHGASWSGMVPIYSGGCFSGNHCHVTAGGPDSVMVVISDDQFNHTNVIQLYSTDGAISFGFASVTTYTLAQSITAFASSTVDPAGRVHMVFTYGETLGTISNINYTTSTDWGQNWSTPVAVNDVTTLFFPWAYQSGQMPAIAVAPLSGAIYVAWADQRGGAGDFEVYLSRSTDDGVTWDADVMVNVIQTPLNQGWVSLAVDDLGGGNAKVLVTWNDDRFAVGVPEISADVSNWIHPVPATDRIYVDLPWTSTGPIQYSVLDARGAIVHRGTWITSGPQVVDVASLNAGMHVLRVASEERVVSIPWIKE